MTNRISCLAAAAIVAQTMATACVQSRPSRNGVFNENQYLRKDFLVQQPNATTPDPGWWLKGTIVAVSTPNPLGSADFGLSPGIDSGAVPVRFVITSDKLNMVSTREMSATDAASPEVTPATVNAWPVTNVDLMYQVNLDGETTNFYQTNQERPWQDREWVQVNLDKNDMSDLAPLGEGYWNLLSNCVDTANVSTTLVPNSFLVDEPHNYMQWTVAVTLPLIWDDTNCVFAYGDLGQEAEALGKQSVTINLMYSLTRALPLSQVTYQPLVVDEKDPIHHKYGFFPNITENRDPTTGLLASQEMVERFDPQKPLVWYFAQGFDPAYKHFFTDSGTGIVDRTNAIFAQTGAPIRLQVREYDDPGGPQPLAAGQGPRQYGDIRYNFLVWMSDEDSQQDFAGVTEFDVDYRTGETMSANIAFNTFAFQDYYVQRINSYLLSIGAAGCDPSVGSGASCNGDSVNNPGEWPTIPTIEDSSQAAPNCTTTQTPNSCEITVQPAPKPGSSVTPPSSKLYCVNGSTVPLQSVVNAAVHNGTSTVFGKMQAYLGKPIATYGNLGPADFIQTQDQDFYNAYYALLPYIIYADPAQNPYTIPEGGNGIFGPPAASAWPLLQQEVQFHQTAYLMDPNAPGNYFAGPNGGNQPYDLEPTTGTGVANAAAFADAFRTLGQAHQDFQYNKIWQNGQVGMRHDGIDSLAFESVADEAGRACQNGAWETKEQWTANLSSAYWNQVEFHEFGHSLGLTHNFMASVDGPNFPTFTVGSTQVPVVHTSSVMEYNASIDRVTFATPDWGPYDKGAIAWIYANTAPDGQTYTACPQTNNTPPCSSISGQATSTSPWQDPLGFNGTTETQFLFCNEAHLKYTPFCRQGDLGRTPSEIVANQLDAYEWEFQWRNYRQYHKFWDDSLYANAPAALFTDLTRFVSLWAFDWSSTEIVNTLERIGVTNPSPTTQSNVDYFQQLSNKFNAEISTANQTAAAYHIAMLNQAQDERPAGTVYDAFYGDVTQQGIILDKYFAMQNFAGFYPAQNYDPTQAGLGGTYLSWYEGLGDAGFNTLTQWSVVQLLGGVPNVFPYFQPTTVALFAQDTHSPSFASPPIRNWIGGFTFWREQDFLAYFQNIAVQSQYTGTQGCQGNACACTETTTCTYDPREIPDPNISTLGQVNEFIGPDFRRYIWSYIPDRNEWVVAQQDVNIVTNQIMLQYNGDVVAGMDDGNFPGGAYGDELPLKYTADSFTQFN